jgi:hypothetical protein
LPFGVNITIEFETVTTTSEQTDTHVSQNSTWLDIVIDGWIFYMLRSIAVLIPNRKFLDCVTVAFSYLTFMNPCIFWYNYEYNQRDATI